jgi:2-polyprenyl-6-hydroxyphenyl methylase/3-demethylubiquinone-9 3-methyltransferase
MRTDNVDNAELAKFSAVSADWWDPEGPFKTLHHINPLRLNFIADRASLAGAHILDVGCGGGLFSEAIARRGAEVTGIDANEDCIAAAQAHARQQGLSIDYVVTSIEAFATDNPTRFDIITCMELLEHVPDFGSVLTACASLLKPSGHLFLSTLNRTPKSYLFAVVTAEYVLGLLPKGTHDYQKFIRPSELATILRRLDMDLVELAGMHYQPLTHSARLTRDMSVNYLVHARNRSGGTG